ncbi:MAG: hypothetical protein GY944_08900 [bacterium]|nr:hypothetical protein [bacterium]
MHSTWLHLARYLSVLTAFALIAHPLPSEATHLDGALMDFDRWVEFEWQAGSTEAYFELIGSHSAYEDGRYLGGFGETSIPFLGMDFFDYGYFDDVTKAYMSFDLILFGDWYGNDPGRESTFTVYFGLNTIFESTFSNDQWINQSYPGSLESGSHPGTTGALLSDYIFDASGPGVFPVSIYQIEIEIETGYMRPSNFDMFAEFAADFAGETSGTWGLDNVVISSSPIAPIPEPSAAALIGVGLTILAARSRRSL